MAAGSDPCSSRETRMPLSGYLVERWRLVSGVGSTLVAWGLLTSCAPQLNAGEWQCPSDGGVTPAASRTDPVSVPWSTSFEERFCDYQQLAGDCYGDSPYVLVTDPVHVRQGRFAAQFDASSAKGADHQTRCIRRGVLPDAAFYGAWYYIPEAPTVDKGVSNPLWNLFHFQTGETPSTIRKLWDVSLIRDSKGDWDLLVFDPVAGKTLRGPDPSPIPFGQWFHVVLFLKRAAGATGALSLYQDDELLVEATNLKSDHSNFTEWFVGNLAEGLEAPTLYVDDVSISATR